MKVMNLESKGTSRRSSSSVSPKTFHTNPFLAAAAFNSKDTRPDTLATRLAFLAAITKFLPSIEKRNIKQAGLFFNKHVMTNKKVLIFVEEKEGEILRHRIDFDSPRTAEAARRINISFEDCYPKLRFEFFTGEVTKTVAQRQYEQHCSKTKNLLKNIFELRGQMIRSEEKQAEIAKMKEKAWTQKTGKTYPQINTSISDSVKPHIITPLERKKISDYVQQAMKEVKQAEKKTKLSERSVSQNSLASHSKIAKQISLPQNESTFFQTASHIGEDPLVGQVQARLRGRERVVKNLELERKRSQNLAQIEKKAWEDVQNHLEEIQNKISNASKQAEHLRFQKVMFACRTSRNLDFIHERAQSQLDIQKHRNKEKYIGKTEKIRNSSVKREWKTQEKTQSTRINCEQKRFDQKKRLRTLQLEEEKSLDFLRRELEIRSTRATSKFSEKQQSWKKQRAINLEIQRENLDRINRLGKERRRRVLAEYDSRRGFQNAFHNAEIQNQIATRTKYVAESQACEIVSSQLDRLLKIDPNNVEEREKIKTTIRKLNTKFFLNIDFYVFNYKQ